LANRYTKRKRDTDAEKPAVDTPSPVSTAPLVIKPYISTETAAFIGGTLVPRVIVDISRVSLKDPAMLGEVGYKYDWMLDKYHMGEQSVDFVYLADQLPSFTMPGNLKQLYDYPTWKTLADKANAHPVFTLQEFIDAELRDTQLNLVRICHTDLTTPSFEALPVDKTIIFLLETNAIHGMADQRQFFAALSEIGLDN